jgi:hypothetical protein
MSRLPPCHNYADRAYGIVIAKCTPVPSGGERTREYPRRPRRTIQINLRRAGTRARVVPSKGLFTRADNRRV